MLLHETYASRNLETVNRSALDMRRVIIARCTIVVAFTWHSQFTGDATTHILHVRDLVCRTRLLPEANINWPSFFAIARQIPFDKLAIGTRCHLSRALVFHKDYARRVTSRFTRVRSPTSTRKTLIYGLMKFYGGSYWSNGMESRLEALVRISGDVYTDL